MHLRKQCLTKAPLLLLTFLRSFLSFSGSEVVSAILRASSKDRGYKDSAFFSFFVFGVSFFVELSIHLIISDSRRELKTQRFMILHV